MVSLLYVTEYAEPSQFAPTLGPEPGSNQVVNYAGGTTQSTAFKTNTTLVRLHTDSVCSVRFGLNPTATTSDARLAAGQTEYFKVLPGNKVAAIINT
jgi:hypothetical protein